MEPIRINSKTNVKKCSLCPKETEYYCHSCIKDLCRHCKAIYVIDLDSKHHEVTIYREKSKCFLKQDGYLMHRNRIYNKYCESCEVPVFYSCPRPFSSLSYFSTREHNNHKLFGMWTAYQTKRQQNKKLMQNISSEKLYYKHVQMETLKADVQRDIEKCHEEISRCQSEVMLKGIKLKDLIDRCHVETLNHTAKKYDRWILRQESALFRSIAKIRMYEHFPSTPVKFLRFVKKAHLPRLQETPHLSTQCLLILTQKFNTQILIQLLSEIQIIEGKKRNIKAGNDHLFSLMPSPVSKKSYQVAAVNSCGHISCVTPNKVWVCDDYSLVLTDTTSGDTLFSVKDVANYSWSGSHTVNHECELIYRDKNQNIKKLCKDTKTRTLIEKPRTPWEKRCVYISPSTGDLLVGMYIYEPDLNEAILNRYNDAGRQIQSIPHNDTAFFSNPHYITENRNGDIVVSDFWLHAVVVTSSGGIHRFSYTGPSAGSEMLPHGVCTDSLSHILVCDDNTKTVQMLDKDGHFLSVLLSKESPGIFDGPFSMSYDDKKQLLWVGTGNKTLSIYRYINRHLTFTG